MSALFVVIKNGAIIECTADHEVGVNVFLSQNAEGMYKIEGLDDLLRIYQHHRDEASIESLSSKICKEAKEQTANLLKQLDKLKDSDSAKKVQQMAEDTAAMARDIWAQFTYKLQELVKKDE